MRQSAHAKELPSTKKHWSSGFEQENVLMIGFPCLPLALPAWKRCICPIFSAAAGRHPGYTKRSLSLIYAALFGFYPAYQRHSSILNDSS